jgi:very-short-patch-repair endonuclease
VSDAPPDADDDQDPDPQRLPQPEEADEPGELAARHRDARLQTVLSSERLQKRLFDLAYDARLLIEEQGINILYFAIGALHWREADAADIARRAPLVLVPVRLERTGAASRFAMAWTEDEIVENISLRARLKNDFRIELPELPTLEELDLVAYFDAVAKAVAGQANWSVAPDDMVLGLFSFAKYLMYRDLDADTWPDRAAIDRHPVVAGLLGEGFPGAEPSFAGEERIDAELSAERLAHVVDADSSQTIAIERARRGENLVVQGPPGTGKSQTIANIIAAAVRDGRTVLFVAEKMAALDVVKRRLDAVHVGDACLELHSHKANKKALLAELKRTLELGRPDGTADHGFFDRLQAARAELNAVPAALNEKLAPAGVAPQAVMGHLVRLCDRAVVARGLALAGADTWSRERKADADSIVRDLATRAIRMGAAGRHAWRGVERDDLIASDRVHFTEDVAATRAALSGVIERARRLAAALSQPMPERPADIDRLVAMAQMVGAAPEADATAIGSRVWLEHLATIGSVVAAGRTYAAARRSVGDRVLPAAWTTDLATARQAIARAGWHLLAVLFDSGYRRGLRELASVLKGEPPRTKVDRLALLDTLMTGRQAEADIERGAYVAAAAFGTQWAGPDSDWDRFAAVHQWVSGLASAGLPANFRAVYAALPDRPAVVSLGCDVAAAQAAALGQLDNLLRLLRLDLARAFGATTVPEVELAELSNRLAAWQADPEGVDVWRAYRAQERRAVDAGLGDIAARLAAGTLEPETAPEVLDHLYYDALIRHARQRLPALAAFDGAVHDTRISAFRDADEQRIRLAQYEAALAHYRAVPRDAGGIGPLGIVRREIEKKTRHLPIRRLMQEAGAAVQAIKPVFMMSPLSVAQFLPAGAIDFDLLVVDEASQVEPVDALGAIARCRQIVVVGDQKQLPPTRFFARALGSSVPDDDNGGGTADLESVLGLCAAKGLPATMLRWHYRSRHQSLIAVSNKHFYDSRLFIVPSPQTETGTRGLVFRHLPRGVYDRGGARDNKVEAREVAATVIAHARATPEKSLGVGTFSIPQRRAVLDELELLRRQNLDLEPFFARGGPEPFFVKNLENIQGDERDVILISVGYGRDRDGHLALAFGPLNAEGGERRLNVLITRAKERLEVFSALRADDIDLERARSAGVVAFKAFLQYAERGVLDVAHVSGRDVESPFEDQVLRALQREGYDVRPQIGIAGFFIDLAVVDPHQPSRYLLGIECDGATYHASRSARDRDRLRQLVLERHGWTLYRVWSADWWQRPEEQLRRLVARIEELKAASAAELAELAEHRAARTTADTAADEVACDAMVIDAETGTYDGAPTGSEGSRPGLRRIAGESVAATKTAYVESDFAVPATDLVATPRGRLAECVAQIIATEGPIHRDEITTRLRTLWGYQRAGAAIRAAIEAAIDGVVRLRGHVVEGDFVWRDDARIEPRDRAAVRQDSLRRAESLPPPELRAAVLAIIDRGLGAHDDELPRAVAALLGVSSAPAAYKAALAAAAERLAAEGTIEHTGDYWRRRGP